jgi:uncharacterized protein YaiE (UPF0345 family)
MSGTKYNEHFSGRTVSVGNFPEKSNTLSFNTKTSAETDNGIGNPKMVCVSKGSLESEILKCTEMVIA